MHWLNFQNCFHSNKTWSFSLKHSVLLQKFHWNEEVWTHPLHSSDLGSQHNKSVFIHLTSKSAVTIFQLFCEWTYCLPKIQIFGQGKKVILCCLCSCMANNLYFSESCRCSCWGRDGNNKDWFSHITNTLLYIHKGQAQLANNFCLYLTSWKVCGFSVN